MKALASANAQHAVGKALALVVAWGSEGQATPEADPLADPKAAKAGRKLPEIRDATLEPVAAGVAR